MAMLTNRICVNEHITGSALSKSSGTPVTGTKLDYQTMSHMFPKYISKPFKADIIHGKVTVIIIITIVP